MDVQFTLADGFFNRKRGRPPKNRYVQVYKNLQLPPQAVFTSFKLERTEISLSLPIVMENDDGQILNTKNIPITGVESIKETPQDVSGKTDGNNIEMDEIRKVVRSTGIYFPDNIRNISNIQSTEKFMNISNDSVNISKSLPKPPSAVRIYKQIFNSQLTYSYLQMLQLINVYRRNQFSLQWNVKSANLKRPLTIHKDHDISHSGFDSSEFCRYCEKERDTAYLF